MTQQTEKFQTKVKISISGLISIRYQLEIDDIDILDQSTHHYHAVAVQMTPNQATGGQPQDGSPVGRRLIGRSVNVSKQWPSISSATGSPGVFEKRGILYACRLLDFHRLHSRTRQQFSKKKETRAAAGNPEDSHNASVLQYL